MDAIYKKNSIAIIQKYCVIYGLGAKVEVEGGHKSDFRHHQEYNCN